MKNFNKKIVLALIVTFIFSPSLAPRAQAQYVDIVQSAKEMGLDLVGWMVPKMIIQRMSASTVNWINSGFKGKPAYLTNPEAFFTDIGDKVAGKMIFQNPNLNFLCGPISAKIKIALAKTYVGRSDRYQCTLTQVGKNMESFMGNFQNGGWDNFFEISQKQQNNPIGAYIQAEGDLAKEINKKSDTKLNDLNQGKGIMSFEKCEQVPFVGPMPEGQTPPPSEEVCTTVTPGAVIADGLNKSIGAGTDGLVTADELNELIGSLLNQLTSQVLGGVGGLLGGSAPDSGGGSSLSRQLLESTAESQTDYFGNSVQEQSNPPPPDPKDYTVEIIDGTAYMSDTRNLHVTDTPNCLPEDTEYVCTYPDDYNCVSGPESIDLIKANREIKKKKGQSFGMLYPVLVKNLKEKDCSPAGIVPWASGNNGGVGNYEPGGVFDSADCNTFSGWTCDANNYSTAIDVHFYDGSTVGGTFIGAVNANVAAEQAVADLCGGYPAHRFSFVTPDSVKNGNSHMIYAYAINTPSGNNPALSGSPKSLTCPASGN